MHEEGCISAVNGGMAEVRVVRGTACDGCASSGACKTLGGGKEMVVEAINAAGAGIGDRVRIEIPSSSVAWMAFMVYLIPVLALVLGAILGTEAGAALSLDPELCALGVALTGFTVAFLVVRRIGQSLAGRRDYTPVISRVL